MNKQLLWVHYIPGVLLIRYITHLHLGLDLLR